MEEINSSADESREEEAFDSDEINSSADESREEEALDSDEIYQAASIYTTAASTDTENQDSEYIKHCPDKMSKFERLKRIFKTRYPKAKK